MFLETSQDVLYITVSICTLVFTGFLCWVLFYLAHLLKQSNQITEELHGKIQDWTEAVDEIKERVMNTAATLSTLGDQVGRVIDFVNRRRESGQEGRDDYADERPERPARRKSR